MPKYSKSNVTIDHILSMVDDLSNDDVVEITDAIVESSDSIVHGMEYKKNPDETIEELQFISPVSSLESISEDAGTIWTAVSAHFDQVSAGYQCKYCDVILQVGTKLQNLVAHVKEHMDSGFTRYESVETDKLWMEFALALHDAGVNHNPAKCSKCTPTTLTRKEESSSRSIGNVADDMIDGYVLQEDLNTGERTYLQIDYVRSVGRGATSIKTSQESFLNAREGYTDRDHLIADIKAAAERRSFGNLMDNGDTITLDRGDDRKVTIDISSGDVGEVRFSDRSGREMIKQGWDGLKSVFGTYGDSIDRSHWNQIFSETARSLVDPKLIEIAGPFSKACAMAPASKYISERLYTLQQSIPPAAIAEKGLEKDPHVTVFYGFEDQHIPIVKDILESFPPFEVTIGSSMVFDPGEHSQGSCPVVLQVESMDLREIHHRIRVATGVTPNFEYHPHMTVGYLNPDHPILDEYRRGVYLPTATKSSKFIVDRIHISDTNDHIEEVMLQGTFESMVESFNKDDFAKSAKAYIDAYRKKHGVGGGDLLQQYGFETDVHRWMHSKGVKGFQSAFNLGLSGDVEGMPSWTNRNGESIYTNPRMSGHEWRVTPGRARHYQSGSLVIEFEFPRENAEMHAYLDYLTGHKVSEHVQSEDSTDKLSDSELLSKFGFKLADDSDEHISRYEHEDGSVVLTLAGDHWAVVSASGDVTQGQSHEVLKSTLSSTYGESNGTRSRNLATNRCVTRPLATESTLREWHNRRQQMEEFEFVTRYDVFGPHNGCNGRCEGTGWIPVRKDHTDPLLQKLWHAAESESPSEDGTHFVPCPECNQEQVQKDLGEDVNPFDTTRDQTRGTYYGWLTKNGFRLTSSGSAASSFTRDQVVVTIPNQGYFEWFILVNGVPKSKGYGLEDLQFHLSKIGESTMKESVSRECYIIEVAPGAWYNVVASYTSHEFTDIWNDRGTDVQGPFPTEQACWKGIRGANPGGGHVIPYPEGKRYMSLVQKLLSITGRSIQLPRADVWKSTPEMTGRLALLTSNGFKITRGGENDPIVANKDIKRPDGTYKQVVKMYADGFEESPDFPSVPLGFKVGYGTWNRNLADAISNMEMESVNADKLIDAKLNESSTDNLGRYRQAGTLPKTVKFTPSVIPAPARTRMTPEVLKANLEVAAGHFILTGSSSRAVCKYCQNEVDKTPIKMWQHMSDKHPSKLEASDWARPNESVRESKIGKIKPSANNPQFSSLPVYGHGMTVIGYHPAGMEVVVSDAGDDKSIIQTTNGKYITTMPNTMLNKYIVFESIDDHITCDRCEGSGQILDKNGIGRYVTCDWCDGRGWKNASESVRESELTAEMSWNLATAIGKMRILKNIMGMSIKDSMAYKDLSWNDLPDDIKKAMLKIHGESVTEAAPLGNYKLKKDFDIGITVLKAGTSHFVAKSIHPTPDGDLTMDYEGPRGTETTYITQAEFSEYFESVIREFSEDPYGYISKMNLVTSKTINKKFTMTAGAPGGRKSPEEFNYVGQSVDVQCYTFINDGRGLWFNVHFPTHVLYFRDADYINQWGRDSFFNKCMDAVKSKKESTQTERPVKHNWNTIISYRGSDGHYYCSQDHARGVSVTPWEFTPRGARCWDCGIDLRTMESKMDSRTAADSLIDAKLGEDANDIQVGEHVTFDWDGPSQGVVTKHMPDGRVWVKRDGDSVSYLLWPADLTRGYLKKGPGGYTTVSKKESVDEDLPMKRCPGCGRMASFSKNADGYYICDYCDTVLSESVDDYAEVPKDPNRKCDDCGKKIATHRVGGRKLCKDCAQNALDRKSESVLEATNPFVTNLLRLDWVRDGRTGIWTNPDVPNSTIEVFADGRWVFKSGFITREDTGLQTLLRFLSYINSEWESFQRSGKIGEVSSYEDDQKMKAYWNKMSSAEFDKLEDLTGIRADFSDSWEDMSPMDKDLFKDYLRDKGIIENHTYTEAELSDNPPKWVAYKSIWKDVVTKGKHDNYGAAIAHYKNTIAKQGKTDTPNVNESMADWNKADKDFRYDVLVDAGASAADAEKYLSYEWNDLPSQLRDKIRNNFASGAYDEGCDDRAHSGRQKTGQELDDVDELIDKKMKDLKL